MLRRLTTVLLMLCICWRALACAGTAVVVADADEVAHAAMHFEGMAHHHDVHDDDGGSGIHLDDSAASAQHLMDDACAHAPALLPRACLPLATTRPDMPLAAIASAAPPPFLGGLERPPRSTT